MNDFRAKLYEFMRGRNGSDELYIFMSAAYIIMIIINAFVRSRIFSAIILAWFILTMFRFFSKDIYRRQNENAKFVTLLNRIKNKNFKRDPYAVKTKKDSKLKRKIKMYKTMFKDRKTHVFKKCPQCKAMIRLPKRKGSHEVICPKCGREFKIKVR